MFSPSKIITHRRVARAIAFSGAICFSLVLISLPKLRGYSQMALVEAAVNGNVSLMRVLLTLGADVDEFECQAARCRTPLVAAAQGG